MVDGRDIDYPGNIGNGHETNKRKNGTTAKALVNWHGEI
jgi:hypothetical protein